MNLKKGVVVKIISGKDKGKTGEILEINNIGLDIDSLEDLKKLKSSKNKCKTTDCTKALSL